MALRTKQECRWLDSARKGRRFAWKPSQNDGLPPIECPYTYTADHARTRRFRAQTGPKRCQMAILFAKTRAGSFQTSQDDSITGHKRCQTRHLRWKTAPFRPPNIATAPRNGRDRAPHLTQIKPRRETRLRGQGPVVSRQGETEPGRGAWDVRTRRGVRCQNGELSPPNLCPSQRWKRSLSWCGHLR